jgi:putative hemolysin
MANVTTELLVILILLLANGFLALSEIAVVSARRSRLLQLAEHGDLAAAAAADLSQSPTRFLSTVQVGITLIGILSGAYGGATIAEALAVWLGQYPSVAAYSEQLAVGIVVVALSYFSVIIGELVPKRIALNNPEKFASLVARPMRGLSRIAGPAVLALEHSSNIIMKILRLPQGSDSAVTEADVAAMIAAGTASGVFEPEERRMMERVFRLDDEPVAAMMTPRPDIIWLDSRDSFDTQLDVIARHPYSRFPVAEGSLDRIRGIVDVRDICIAQRRSTTVDLAAMARTPLFVPDRAAALDVLRQFQTSGTQIAILIDEHGGVDGLVTQKDVLMFLAAPAADPSALQAEGQAVVRRDDGSWLVDGSVPIADFYSAIGVSDPDDDQPRSYHTVAGLALTALGRVPQAGDRVSVGALILEVADMDGRRVDKVLVTLSSPSGPPAND